METICLKCLCKEPARRYLDGLELVRDLERWLAGDAIAARPAGAVEKVWRWCGRRPALSALGATIVLLLVTVAVVSTVMAARLKVAKDQSEKLSGDMVEKLWDSYLTSVRTGSGCGGGHG